VDALLRSSLEEDRGPGDVTSEHVVPADRRARMRLVAKAAGTLAGLPLFARAFELCDPDARVQLLRQDGDCVLPGDEVAAVEGLARALLLAERTALNFLQRLSGVATITAKFVERAEAAGRTGRKARILDTRKTTPGMRVLEKYAVRCGGGENHRMGLFDQAMVKDNHADLCGRPLAEVVRELRAAVGPELVVTAEARDRDEALAAASAGADVVMLDNMSPEEMEALVPEVRAIAAGRRVEVEASGGIDLSNVAAVAATGVDRISIGALTHSAPALDLSLVVEALP
jgi:nicotinate-nucleotide pyrophosphorylase (carboxylating)